MARCFSLIPRFPTKLTARLQNANASVADWYREHGRHPVYAKNQNLPLPPSLGTIVNAEGEPTLKKRVSLRVLEAR